MRLMDYELAAPVYRPIHRLDWIFTEFLTPVMADRGARVIMERMEDVTVRIGITKRKLLGSSYEQVKGRSRKQELGGA